MTGDAEEFYKNIKNWPEGTTTKGAEKIAADTEICLKEGGNILVSVWLSH